jgi:hypothetical protein
MLDPDLADDLRTIAEVSVTVAGFAAVTGAIRFRGDAELLARSKANFSALLVSGIQAAFLALVPLILYRIPALSEDFWRWCHGVAFIVNTASWIFWYRYSYWGHSSREILAAFTPVDCVAVPLGILVFSCVLIVVLGGLSAYAAVIYLWLLMQLLLVASLNFVQQFSTKTFDKPSET